MIRRPPRSTRPDTLVPDTTRCRAAARAAEAKGVTFCLSTVSACPLDEVAAGTTKPFWFQLYMIRDRAFMRTLLAKAKALGCTALVFTVDMPVPGTRYRDYRSGLAGAAGMLGDRKSRSLNSSH